MFPRGRTEVQAYYPHTWYHIDVFEMCERIYAVCIQWATCARAATSMRSAKKILDYVY